MLRAELFCYRYNLWLINKEIKISFFLPYLMASSILESRLVLVTSLNNSKHSSLVGASMPMLP